MKKQQINCGKYSIGADWYEQEDKKNIMLILTGWNSSKHRYEDFASGLTTLTGYSALVVEYSGHGEDDMELMETRPAQHLVEVICAFDWLRETYPEAKISVIGASYGGYMAAYLAHYRTFECLVLRCPAMYDPTDFFTVNRLNNSEETWEEKMAYRRDYEAILQHPALIDAASFEGRVLVVEHEDDEVIPKESIRAYVDAFGADIYIAKETPHSLRNNTAKQNKNYQAAISQWLTRN